MAKRLRVVILYSYNENWIGGTYYIQNLILALNKVEDNKKPQLLIASNSKSEYDSLVAITGYPYIRQVDLTIKYGLIIRAINKISRNAFKKNLFSTLFSKFDLLFQTEPSLKSDIKRAVLYWIPDFQEHYLPDFFSKEEINTRMAIQSGVAAKGKYILFSSENAKRDFNKFYPGNALKQFVLNFAVTHPALENEMAIDGLLEKYSLAPSYFICCNQFWIHKNHQIVLKAVHKLKQEGISLIAAFTGKDYDHRFPGYYLSLAQMCDELGIKENIRFLGFIERNEQLCLIKHAQAVVQPSLFEGWSTVVEDAKALNSNIIASNIDVHREQLREYPQKLYFDPHSAEELATCMLTKIPQNSCDYEKSIISYGNKFVDIVSSVLIDE